MCFEEEDYVKMLRAIENIISDEELFPFEKILMIEAALEKWRIRSEKKR